MGDQGEEQFEEQAEIKANKRNGWYPKEPAILFLPPSRSSLDFVVHPVEEVH